MTQHRLRISAVLGTDLSSRATAAQVRNEITQKVVERQEPVYLDFADVRTVSSSFADELFAVLVEQFGRAWFREWLRLENLSESIRYTILEAISTRINSHHAGA